MTFTPRVLCVERATQLTPVPILEEPCPEGPALWDKTRLEKAPPPLDNRHPFIQDLDGGVDTNTKDYAFESSVRGWGDLLRARLHPRSVLAGYQKLEDDLEDRIRLYVEECDNIQGFQILVDATESYPEVLSFLEDEFSSKSRVAFPVVAGVGELSWRDAATRFIRTFLSYHDTAVLSSLTVPLSCVQELSVKPEVPQTFPDLSYSLEASYHTSAILASFIDTFSLTYRSKNNESQMSDVIAGLTSRGWKLSAASLALPFPMLPGTSLKETLEARVDEAPLWSSLTPGAVSADSLYQTLALRGVPDGGVLLEYMQYLSSTVTAVCSVHNSIPTLPPFPKFFSSHVSTRGSVDPSVSRMPGFDVNAAPVLAGLHASHTLGTMLSSVTSMASKINVQRLPLIDIEPDLLSERIETMNALASLHSWQMDID